MDDELRALLSAVLAAPDDLTPRLLLADWLNERSDPRANKVRKHCETGDIYLRSYTMAGDGAGRPPSVAFLILQMIPQPLAIEFGCRCADRVTPVFHREWRNDMRPDQILAAVRSWLQGEQTKKWINQLAWRMADVVDDAAAEPPAGVEWDRDRGSQRYRAVCAARSAVNVAVAVGFPAESDRWVSEVCQCAIEAIGAADSRARERTWQRRELAKLLRAEPGAAAVGGV